MGILSTERVLRFFVCLMVVLLINPLHECAHALVAYKLGDNTAKERGRLTLSPLAHIDPLGALLLLFCGFGWAKPVPVNPMNFKNRRLGMMLTAIAGPVSNLLAALVGVVIMQLCAFSLYRNEYLYVAVFYFVIVNINLALFNLIPVPPLDGSRILTYFLPPRAELWLMRNQAVFYGLMMILLMTGILSGPLSVLVELIAKGMLFITDWIPAVF